MKITIEIILGVHSYSISKYGGADGIRDMGLLESSIARPFQTFDGIELYKDIFEKAAALGESIIVNHPFIDGNKRTGFLAMVAWVEYGGYVVKASEDNAYNFIVKISTGDADFNQIVSWLKANTDTSVP